MAYLEELQGPFDEYGMASDNSWKPSIQTALEQGGHYLLLCADSYSHSQIEWRVRAIHEAFESAGISAAKNQKRFLDGSQTTDWVNAHRSSAIWVKEQSEHSSPNRLSSWNDWQGRREHEVPFADDTRIESTVRAIQDRLSKGPSYRRLAWIPSTPFHGALRIQTSTGLSHSHRHSPRSAW